MHKRNKKSLASEFLNLDADFCVVELASIIFHTGFSVKSLMLERLLATLKLILELPCCHEPILIGHSCESNGN